MTISFLPRLPGWVRRSEPPWLGPLVAAVTLLLTVLAILTDVGSYESPGQQRLIRLALLVYALAMLLEIGGVRWPKWLFLVLALGPIAWATLAGRDTIVPMLAMLVVWWVTFTWSQRAGIAATLCALLSILPPFVTGRGSLDNLFSWSISLVLIWVSVYSFVVLRRTLAELRNAQAHLARQAAAEERRRLAREVHDVVAHSLAITLLHVTGARHILARDPQRAAEALAQAEALGRQSMADLRRTVGLLGVEEAGGVAAPAPGAVDIPVLIDAFKSAGLAVEAHIGGNLAGLSAGLGLDLYRLIQEALTNVAKHGAGVATLALHAAEHEVRLRVTNTLPATTNGATPSGRGLLGMRERVASYGGTLAAGPANGQWRIDIQLPLLSHEEGLP